MMNPVYYVLAATLLAIPAFAQAPATFAFQIQFNTTGPNIGGVVAINNAQTGAPLGSCNSGSCSVSIPAGTSVRITGNPNYGSTFGWLAGSNTGCAAGNAPCIFTMSAARKIIANFSPGSSVTVTVFVNGYGKVSGGLQGSSPSFQNCTLMYSPGCVTSGPAGSTFILTANPGFFPPGPFGQSKAARFAGWSGQGCNGTMVPGNGIKIVASTSVTCTAKFQ